MQVIILKDIIHPPYSVPFYKHSSHIDYDTKHPVNKKMHCLYYQQGARYGQVGDQCDYLSHDELLRLEQEGFVMITSNQRKELLKRGKEW